MCEVILQFKSYTWFLKRFKKTFLIILQIELNNPIQCPHRLCAQAWYKSMWYRRILFWILFINDTSGKISISSFTWSKPNITALQETVSNDLKTIKSWCDSNLLSYCFQTKILSYNSMLQSFLLINSTRDVFNSVKFLGLIIDSSLKWDFDMDYLSKK